MPERSLAILVFAKGAEAAARSIGKVDNSIKGLGSNIRNVARNSRTAIIQGFGQGLGQAAYGAFNEAVGASIDFLTQSVQAAAEEEAGIASLTAALKANVAGWDGNTAAIEATIAARERLAFSDDDLRASLAILVGATGDITKAFDIQSVAMDLARYKHISLQEASEALIRVENGQYRLLKSLGIEIPKNATALEVLALVEKYAAGQAQAYANTTQGSFDQLGIAVQDLQEDIGKGLAPAANDLAKGLEVYGIPAVRGLMDALGGLGDVARAILGPLGLIPDAISAIADAAQFAASPLGNLNDLLGQVPGPWKGGTPPSTPAPAPTQYRGHTSPAPTTGTIPVLPGEHHGGHAAGLLGMTSGPTSLGWAGEAGNEAVAILRNPHPLGSGYGTQPIEVTVRATTTVSARDVNHSTTVQRRVNPRATALAR